MGDSTQDTLDHISKVQVRIAEFQAALDERAAVHDRSKLKEPEKSGFDVLSAKLAAIQYGTDEYREALKEGQPTIDHHYMVNSHHPEHWPNGIRGMSLLDLVEMFCDWKAAGERTKQGSMEQSLRVNFDRFSIDSQLAAIFENTRRELDW
jgi:hypothetical protein